MLWIAQDHKMPERDVGGVVRLDPTPLHGASVNDAPPCEHGNIMGAIKRDPNNPGTLIIQYWRCKCQVPLVGAELLRRTRQMREVIAKRRQHHPQRQPRPWQGGDAA